MTQTPPPSTPPSHAQTCLIWGENDTPKSTMFDDVYYSIHDGLAETRLNFLTACGLPERWRNQAYFCIAELGFGTGLNFAASVAAWRDSERPPRAQLDFISFEKYPLRKEDAANALKHFPELDAVTDPILAQWPISTDGTQALCFPQWGVRLILHIGDANAALPASQFKADAWFLDGFSPAKNPEMWQESLFPLIAERSAEGAKLGSFTVAGHVRRGLEAAGFTTEKQPGFGRKRHRLEASLPNRGPIQPHPKTPLKIAILGAGIAGASVAARLQPLCDVTVFELAKTHTYRASANPLALVIPRLDLGDTPEAKACRAAYGFALHTLKHRQGVTLLPAHHAPRDNKQAKKFEKLKAVPPLPATHLDWDDNGLIYPHALLIQPPLLCACLLKGVHIQTENTHPKVDLDASTVNSKPFDAIILAIGPHLSTYLTAGIIGLKSGQVDWIGAPNPEEAFAKNNGHYSIGDGQIRLWGSSFLRHENPAQPPIPSSEVSVTLKQNVADLLAPEWLASLNAVHSRASIRATTPNHLPYIGRIPNTLRRLQSAGDSPDNAYVLGGLGSRGFGFASLGAEIIASQILNLPEPLNPDIMAVLDPHRAVKAKPPRAD